MIVRVIRPFVLRGGVYPEGMVTDLHESVSLALVANGYLTTDINPASKRLAIEAALLFPWIAKDEEE
jgi:hypothetical protein